MATNALTVVPLVCPIPASGGTSRHKLVNQSSRRLAFKVHRISWRKCSRALSDLFPNQREVLLQVKCSNNSNYTVNVNRGFLGVGEEIEMVCSLAPSKSF